MSHLSDPRPQRSTPGLDPARIAFWAALAVAAGAAGVALTSGPEVGRLGVILFLGLAGVAAVFFLWMSRNRGRQIGLFPDRGAAEAAAGLEVGEYAVLEAISEPALVSDRAGAVVAANQAYRRIAVDAGALSDSARPPALDRLFGADALMSAPMYRLSRAASMGEQRSEILPPAVLSPGTDPRRFEASVAPAPGGRILWRLRPLTSTAIVEGDAARTLFVDDAPLGFFAARQDGAVVYVNQALRALLGFGDETPMLRLRDFVKEDPARVLRRDRRNLGATRTEVTLRARDGAETPAVVLTYWPAADGDAACRALVFVGEGEGLPEASAPERPARVGEPTEAFFDHAPFGAALLDGADPAAAGILDANQALMEMAQGRAAPGARFADLFDAGEGLDQLLAKLRKSSQGAPVELSLATEPAAAAHVHIVRMGDGRALAYVINVTEQRELEQRLAQAEKMREIGLLAGGVAHDFNNLLTVMMQTTDYLLLRHPVGDPDYAELNQINIHALRAKELSEMLRAYARQQTFRNEIVEVAGFMQQMHEIGRRLAGDAVKMEIRHGQNLPFVKVDRAQLERVLVNLISNARDAMTPDDQTISRGGTLTLKTSHVTAADVRRYARNVPIDERDYIEIGVGDTGCGIKEDDRDKIFHPFHSTKEPNRGTGLGLATCYGIIKQSGGYIFFDSVLGKGTTFRVFLPAYIPTPDEREDMARRERAQVERRPVDASGRGRRILFVEDDDDVRMSTARNLREFGFEIELAEDGEEALRILREKPGHFDVVISDVSMPAMNGPDMLRAAGPELIGAAKVLLLSGYAPESVQKVIDNIPVSFLSKPVGARALAERVKELLAA
ncbi:MAG: ATP-binding protein [Caulobacterales bacterium]